MDPQGFESAPRPRLLIFAKLPAAGHVKTRLVPPLTLDEAAALAGAFLLDALERWSALPGIDTWLYLAVEGDDRVEVGRALPSLLRSPLQERITVRMQNGSDLGQRLHAAFADAFGDGCTKVCAIGSDHPTLWPATITEAFAHLDDHDIAIGPADDGGYYLLGLRMLHRELLIGLPYSSPVLFDTVMAAARDAGLDVATLPGWYDVDDARSLERLRADRGRLSPGSHTAVVLAAIDARIESESVEQGACNG